MSIQELKNQVEDLKIALIDPSYTLKDILRI